MTDKQPSTGYIVTRDGVRLLYTQAGTETGPQLLFIPGWRQTASQWKKQTTYFVDAGYHVTTYDHRSHGESETTNRGLRVSSFAADLLEILRKLDLTSIHVVAHSMACSVIWALWDLFPAEARQRISSLVLVDQSACMVAHPSWTAEQASGLSAIFPPEGPYAVASDMAAQGVGLLRSMFVGDFDVDDFEWALRQNQKMSNADAAALLLDHAFKDWRDVLPHIDVPTLVVAAEASVFPAAGVQWLATQIPHASLETFGSNEGGSHFMFWQNSDKFNSVVEAFVSSHGGTQSEA